jgi:hypothetical protein
VRKAFVSATLFKNTQYGSGSGACRARYDFVEKCKIPIEVALNLEFYVVRCVSWGQSEGHALMMAV